MNFPTASQGERVPAVAASMGRHEHTIRSWLKAYLQDGLDGLKEAPPIGRTNHKEQAAVTMLQPVLAKPPSDYGYLEAGWHANLLVDYLRRQGLEVSESTVKRTLKRDGWVYKRSAKTMSIEAPSAEEKIRADKIVSAIKSRQAERDLAVLFVDESHFAMRLTCNEAGSEQKASGKCINLKRGKARQSLGP